jgi:hypothetical protein
MHKRRKISWTTNDFDISVVFKSCPIGSETAFYKIQFVMQSLLILLKNAA